MKICTFAGHRTVYDSSIADKLTAAIQGLLQTDNEFCFYSGGMGQFDRLCEWAVRKAQRENPHLKMELILVLPYLTNALNQNKEYYESSFDGILVPSELIGVHYKGAIQKRNRWMVNHSDYLLAYVRQDFGGAYQTLQYARRKPEMTILNLADCERKQNQ